MRHGKTHNHLGRTASHRKALLANMASSLILHKRITTTLAKAKELRKYVEPLLNKSKTDSTHSRRTVFSYLHNKEVIKELFDNVSEKISSRPGGYTRIIKLENRLGDNADMCIIELVDYNELMLKEDKSKIKTRRSRRGSSSAKSQDTPSAELVSEEKPKAESPSAATDEIVANEVKETTTESTEETKEVSDKSVESKEEKSGD
ncbi:MAG: 50S ribosomal protein L17 [Cytophagales bacterium]